MTKGVLKFAVFVACIMVTGICAAAVAADVMQSPNGTNWNAVMGIGTLASVGLSIISGGYTWLSNRDRVTADNFAKLEKEFTAKQAVQDREIHELELRLATLTGRVEGLPTEKRMDDVVKAIGAVEKDVAALASTVKAQGGALEGIAASARSISEFLLKDKTDAAIRKHR